MSGKDRVLRALKNAGAQGITRVDFQLPDVIDGGPPVLHVPGRIHDLRNQGVAIDDVGIRDSCTVYVLREYRLVSGGTPTAPVEGSVGTSHAPIATGVPPESSLPLGAPAPAPRCAIFDDDWESAA